MYKKKFENLARTMAARQEKLRERYARTRRVMIDSMLSDLHDIYRAETSRNDKCKRKRAAFMATRLSQ